MARTIERSENWRTKIGGSSEARRRSRQNGVKTNKDSEKRLPSSRTGLTKTERLSKRDKEKVKTKSSRPKSG